MIHFSAYIVTVRIINIKMNLNANMIKMANNT